jgi:hypothetical protein
MSGSGVWSGLPGYLTGDISNCYLWNNTTNVWETLSSTLYTTASPILEFGYQMTQKYPNDDIMLVMGAVGGTDLFNNWKVGGGNYTTNQYRCEISLKSLTGRTISQKGILWGQGETDAAFLDRSAAYEALESAMFTGIRAITGATTVIGSRIHDQLPAGTYPYVATVNTAKDNNDTADANYTVFNTDDGSVYTVSGDNIHYNQAGFIALGNKFSTYF